MKPTILWLGEFPVDCPLQDSAMRVHYKAMLPDDGDRIFIDTRSNGGSPLSLLLVRAWYVVVCALF